MSPLIDSPLRSARYRSEAEASAILQQMEMKHDLLHHKIAGWSVWPLLRFSISRELQNLPLDKGGTGLSRAQLVRCAAADLIEFAWVRRAPYVAKTFSSLQVERSAGRKKDIFFDDIPGTEGYYKIEVINSPRVYLDSTPSLTPRDISTTALNLLTDRLARRRPPPGLSPVARALSDCIRSELGLEHYTADAVEAALAGFVWGKKMNRHLLARVRPKCLLLADTADYAITAAARELRINVVEFQHGFTHRHFPGNSWTADSLRHKSTMALPHRILVFGPHWQRELAALGFWSDELRIVGSTRVDTYRRQSSQREDQVCTLVVTTQGTDTERLIAFLADFVREARGRLAFKLMIKLHPSYATSARRFNEAFATAAEVAIVSGSELPSTFELLQRAHLHVSIYSTCHYEALALGIPTVILPLTGHENVLHLHAAGHAFMPSSPRELLDIALRWREWRVTPEVGAQYFEPNARENIRRELESLTAPSAA